MPYIGSPHITEFDCLESAVFAASQLEDEQPLPNPLANRDHYYVVFDKPHQKYKITGRMPFCGDWWDAQGTRHGKSE